MSTTSLIVRVTSWMTLVLLIMLSNSSAAPAPIRNEAAAWSFLRRYGYVPMSHGLRHFKNERVALREYLRDMQRNAGIEMTGELDSETLRMMNSRMCGVTDRVTFRSRFAGGLQNRYALEGSKWNSTELTYGFKYYSEKLSEYSQRQIIGYAFNEWARVTKLRFNETDWQNADLEIQFVSGNHGDGSAFDGPDGLLGHASSPRHGGHIHFDEDEDWGDSFQYHNGTDLLAVALHMTGHALGLKHSDDPDSVMYPYVNDGSFMLGDDDIQGIQALYGKHKQNFFTTEA